jgi:hypothetical protein
MLLSECVYLRPFFPNPTPKQLLLSIVIYVLLMKPIFQGVISVKDSDKRLVIQAVHELYDSQFTTSWECDETRKSAIVFIGNYCHFYFLISSCLCIIHNIWPIFPTSSI